MKAKVRRAYYVRHCAKKAAYKTVEEAQARIDGRPCLSVYACRISDHYYIGHGSQEREGRFRIGVVLV